MDLLSLLHQMWQSIMKSCSKILCHITVRKHKTWQCQTEGNYISLRCLGWAPSKQGLLCERPQASHRPWVGQSDQELLVECKYKYIVNMILWSFSLIAPHVLLKIWHEDVIYFVLWPLYLFSIWLHSFNIQLHMTKWISKYI